jgi:predicted RNA binding protein with dsRBD fold (UPF0201 family)
MEHSADNRIARVLLRVRRTEPEQELDAAICNLIEAHELDGREEQYVTAELRRRCRSLRDHTHERFATLWRERIGAITTG